MKDIPIIFSGPMIRALLDGRKTMTRRLAWTFHDVNDNHTKLPTPWQKVKAGDRLWVRETWQWSKIASMPPGPDYPQFVVCAADATDEEEWRSPIHMPRWASRLTLIVTATKIERLQEISEADAKAEGTALSETVRGLRVWHASHRAAFAGLWNHLHGPGAWDANSEVVCLTFKVHKANIDTMPKAEAA